MKCVYQERLPIKADSTLIKELLPAKKSRVIPNLGSIKNIRVSSSQIESPLSRVAIGFDLDKLKLNFESGNSCAGTFGEN